MAQNEIYEDLPEQIRQGNCVLVLGMGIYRGLSQAIGGLQLPDDATLMRHLAEQSGYAKEPLSLPQVAQFYEWNRSRQQLISVIREGFEPFSAMHLPILGIICHLPFKAIITTCVDNLLENEFLRQGKLFDKVVRNEDIPFQRGDRTLLIKLHGTLDDPNSLVLTENDYLDFFDKVPNISNTVKTLCSGCTLLFLGFDLEDQNFKRLYQEVTTKIAKFVRRAFAFDGEPSDYTVQWWQKRNVAIVHIKAAELLAELERQVTQRPTIDLRYRDFQGACRFQMDQQLGEVRRNKYNPVLYVRREEVESCLDGFVSSDKNGLILIGDSGAGKTNTLCHVASKWAEDGHLVLFYDCGGSLSIAVEEDIIRDLAPKTNAPFDALVEQAMTAVREREKRVIWLFDGINEFRDGENRAGELLKRLDAIVGRAHAPDLKLIITCRRATWENLVMMGRVNLFWNKYYPGPEQAISLSRFTAQELEQAYMLYQQRYRFSGNLAKLPVQTRETLRDPLLLRMIAVAYEAGPVPNDASVRVLRDYCKRQTGGRIKDTLFLDKLATILLEQGAQTITLDQLLTIPQLAAGIGDDPDCPFQRLKDSGMLAEIPSERGTAVKFTYDRLLEYFVASHWLAQNRDMAQLGKYLEKTLPNYEQYMPAWSAATMTVAMIPADEALFETLLQLSGSFNYRVRQVAKDSLVTLYADDPEKARRMLHRLIDYQPERKPVAAKLETGATSSELPLRTALQATRVIGREAKEFFLQAAVSRTALQRDIVANELYVLWQQDPELGFLILSQIIGSISPLRSSRPLQLLEFAARFSLSLFANNCHRSEIIGQLSSIWWDQFETKYGIVGKLGGGTIQRVFDRGIWMAARLGIANAAVKTLTLDGAISLDAYFADAAVRSRVRRLADYLDPASDVTQILPDIHDLLGSDYVYPNMLAALVLTIHTFTKFEVMRPILTQLFEELQGASRLWFLLTFVLLSPVDCPADALLELVEDFTQQVQKSNRDDFIRGPRGLFDQIDIGLLPVGLAYGRAHKDMRLLSQVMNQTSSSDLEMLYRYIRGSASVGFYYPDAILDLLAVPTSQVVSGKVDDSKLKDSLVHTLATIGVICHDKLDAFLLRAGADEALVAQIQARSNASLVKRYVDAIGLYNVVAFGCMFCPRIRRMVQTNTIALAECTDLNDIVARVTKSYIDLVIESDYKISEMIAR